MKLLRFILMFSVILIFCTGTIVDLYAQGININFGTNPRVRYLYNVGNTPGGEGEVIGARVERNFCVKSAGDAIYFDIENAVLYQRPAVTFNLINVEYFDDTEREIKLIYDAQNDPEKVCESVIQTTGSLTWKSQSFFIEDAFFGDRQKYNADFRLECADTMTIDVVRVVPIDYYIDYGEVNQEYMIYHVPNADGQIELVTHLDEPCVTTIEESNYIYCNVDDAEILEGSIPDFFISVEYYDSSSTLQMRLQYDSFDDPYKSLSWTNGKGWGSFKTYTWEVEDGFMANRENGGADFRINFQNPGLAINRIMLGFLDYGPASQVESRIEAVADFSLAQNYPNPFNPSTTIQYELFQAAQVSLDIYTINGRKVKTLVNQVQTAGLHTFEWNGLNDAGVELASGVYVYQLRVGDAVQNKKMTLLK